MWPGDAVIVRQSDKGLNDYKSTILYEPRVRTTGASATARPVTHQLIINNLVKRASSSEVRKRTY